MPLCSFCHFLIEIRRRNRFATRGSDFSLATKVRKRRNAGNIEKRDDTKEFPAHIFHSQQNPESSTIMDQQQPFQIFVQSLLRKPSTASTSGDSIHIVFDNAMGHGFHKHQLHHYATCSASISDIGVDGRNPASAGGHVIPSPSCSEERWVPQSQTRKRFSANTSKKTKRLDVSDQSNGEARWQASSEEQRTNDSLLISPIRRSLLKLVKGSDYENLPAPGDYTNNNRREDRVISKRLSQHDSTNYPRRSNSDGSDARSTLVNAMVSDKMVVPRSSAPSSCDCIAEALEIVRAMSQKTHDDDSRQRSVGSS